MHYYLLTTANEVLHYQISETAVHEALSHGVDLGRLDWQPADRPADADVYAVAFRHGFKTSRGIAFPLWPLAALVRPTELRAVAAEADRAHAALESSQGDLLEAMFPGRREWQLENAKGVEYSRAHAMAEAQEEAEAALAPEPKKDLIQFWTEAGGIYPDSAGR